MDRSAPAKTRQRTHLAVMRVVDTRTPALLSALPRRLQPPNPIDMTEIDMSKQYYSDRTHGIDGTVKATLTPTEGEKRLFDAQDFDTYPLGDEQHFWAMQGDPDGQFDLLLVRLPRDIEDGTHPVGLDEKVRVTLVSSEGGHGEATSGHIMGLQWDRETGRVAAGFAFEIEVESSPGRYSIAEGELALDYSARHRLADCPEAAAAPAAGVVTGRFEPAIFPGREQFRADSILFERHDASSQRLIATQTYNGQTQGILVVIEQDEPHACARAFLIVNSVLRLAQATLAEVNWDKQARTLDARLVLESSYAGKPCTLKDGCISFAY